jgi:hypothetical protein
VAIEATSDMGVLGNHLFVYYLDQAINKSGQDPNLKAIATAAQQAILNK